MSVKKVLLSRLRDVHATRTDYKRTTDRLGGILAEEIANKFSYDSYIVRTPFGTAEGLRLKRQVILIPILRSGIALLDSFMHFFENAKVGFVGIRRDETTAEPKLYYHNLPKISPQDIVIVLDPMIATGGSGKAALDILINNGVNEQQISFAAIIASQEGADFLKQSFSKISFTIAQIDKELNAQKFIVPGLGDFGDRYFGTE